MQLHCPSCHASCSLEMLVQDEAARELFAMRGAEIPPHVWPRLISYLGLFRSKTRALAWDRAARLAREVAELSADPVQLEVALAETIESMRAKREAGDIRPLTDHNYLKKVLQGVPAKLSREPAIAVISGRQPGKSRRLEAMAALTEWAANDWLRVERANGLQGLLAISLENSPAAETITCTADIWHIALEGAGLKIEAVDSGRVMQAFKELFKKSLKKWPEPEQLIALLPRRPERKKMERNEPASDEVAKEELRKMQEACRGESRIRPDAAEKGEKP